MNELLDVETEVTQPPVKEILRSEVLYEMPQGEVSGAWRNLLQRMPMATHYTLPEYFREPYFHDKRPFAVLAVNGETARGVLTGWHEGDAVACGLPTRPQVQVEEAGAEQTAEILRQGLEQEAGNAPLISIFSWATVGLDALISHGYRRSRIGEVPMLDLSLGAEALLKKCDKKRRNCIRFAMKSDLQVSVAETREEFDEFYDIYKQWCESKATVRYPREMEEWAFRETAGNRLLLIAKHAGKVIAGSVFRFAPGAQVDYSRNCSLPEFQNLKPNDLLVWRAVEWACAAGFKRMCMGGSHRFLREFGGEMMPVYRYRLDRTFMRRHDLKEKVVACGGQIVRRLPPQLESSVRKILGREKRPGW